MWRIGSAEAILSDYAGFVPAMALAAALAIPASRGVHRALGVSRAYGWLFLMALGLVASATLTPSRDALRSGAIGPGTCDLSGLTLTTPRDFFLFDERALNVLLFVPLGMAIGALPPSRYRRPIAILSFTIPFAIEVIQMAVPALDRTCQSSDVVDNLLGLVLGLGAGIAWRELRRRGRRA